MHPSVEELQTRRELAVSSGKVIVVGDEAKRFPSFQPLSGLFVHLGFTRQAVIKGDFAFGSFELRRDLSFRRSGEMRGTKQVSLIFRERM
jgi:hypothetical protein